MRGVVRLNMHLWLSNLIEDGVLPDMKTPKAGVIKLVNEHVQLWQSFVARCSTVAV